MSNRFIGVWPPRSPLIALSVLLVATTVVFFVGRNGRRALCTPSSQSAVTSIPAHPAAPIAAPATPDQQDIDVPANTDKPADIDKPADTWPPTFLKIKLGKTESQATLGEQFAAAVRQHRGVTDKNDLKVCGEHRLSNRRAFVAICNVGGACFACGGGVEFYDLHRMGDKVHADFKKHGDKITAFGRTPEVSPIAMGPDVPGFLVRGTLCHGGSCEETVEVFSLMERSDSQEDPSLVADSEEKSDNIYTKDDLRNDHYIYKSAEINITTSNTGQECSTRRCIELELRVALQSNRHSKYKDLRVTLVGKAAVIDGDEMVPIHRQWVIPFDDGVYLIPKPLKHQTEE